MVLSFLAFVHHRLARLHRLAIHPHAHALLVRFDHHRLVAHAPHHVKGLHRLAAQGQFLHVGRHPALDRRLHLLVDGEEPVGRRQPLQRLVRPFVVVVLDPVGQPIAGFLDALEARPRQELLLQGLPEPLDLPQRHRMMG